MATNFNDLMNGFGVVTVMNACIYEPVDGYTGTTDCCKITETGAAGMSPNKWRKTGESIDTLKIANITMEGPTKTITGGQYSNPLIKYGKTATMEMQDALGRASTMERFFGCDYVKTDLDAEGGATYGRLSIGDKFPGAFAIEGTTFFINQKTGEKEYVYIFIPQFLPDAILTLTQDAEGDATVFDLNGSVNVTTVADEEGKASRDIFYEIREKSFFLDGKEKALENEENKLEEAKAEAILNLKGYAEILGVDWEDAFVADIQDLTTIDGIEAAIQSARTKIDAKANG